MTTPQPTNQEIVVVRATTTDGEPVDVVGVVNHETKTVELGTYGNAAVVDSSKLEGEGPSYFPIIQ
jgi:hypothetical protein